VALDPSYSARALCSKKNNSTQKSGQFFNYMFTVGQTQHMKTCIFFLGETWVTLSRNVTSQNNMLVTNLDIL